MIYALLVIVGLAIGGILAWLISANRVSQRFTPRLEEVAKTGTFVQNVLDIDKSKNGKLGLYC